MLHSELRTRSLHRLITLAVLAAILIAVFAEDKQASKASAAPDNHEAPEGFTAIFNGKDLSGWHGCQGISTLTTWRPCPGTSGSCAQVDRRTTNTGASRTASWSTTATGLPDHRQGLRRHRAADRLQDGAQGRQRHLPAGHAAGADLGLHQGRRQVEHRRRQGLRRPVEQQPRRAGQGPARPGRQAVRRVEHFRILQVGERTTVYLNDKLVVDHARLENFWDRKLPLLRKGPIQLQTHGGEIRWRNIFVREIPGDEANELLREVSGQKGFEAVFNGKDFDGWAGPVDNYEVKDGAIVCKPDKGGTIYTKEEYGDFVARVEFKLPPGGNNGLAIRYPGKGDTAYVGMCELQVLDDAYKGIDPRQYHGSAYGMVAAQRGYLRPVGEWNFRK